MEWQKRWSFLLALPLLVLIGLPGVAGAQERKAETVTILRCPLGCGIIEEDTILASFVAKEHPWLVLQPQETPGYIYNIREMAKSDKRWKTTVFGTEDTIIQLGV